jgi:hypothetical protein
VVIAEPKLASGAQHAFGVDSEDAPPFDRAPIGHCRAKRCQRHDVIRLQVESTTPHVSLIAVTSVDIDALHLCSIGMLFETHHPCCHDSSDRQTHDLGGLHLQAQ